MKFENIWTGNWANAFHGLRNPMNSWDKSDSQWGLKRINGDETVDTIDLWIAKDYPHLQEQESDADEFFAKCDELDAWLCDNGLIQYNPHEDVAEYFFIGPNDMDLAQRMIAAGSPNDKFLRQIFVSIDITAPMYLWSEIDTYKIGTVADSTSKMHKLASTPITIDCFETDDYNSDIAYPEDTALPSPEGIIQYCESLRKIYLETKDERYWKELIRWLPESWLQTRTWTANYAVLRAIYPWRKAHRLTEWHTFCDMIKTLPYAKELIMYHNE